jgi:hypothetical protein
MPRKLLNSFTELGTGQEAIADTLLGSVATPWALTTWPRYAIWFYAKVHLDIFTFQ